MRPIAVTEPLRDRKSTRLNSSHSQISYAVFCLKKQAHGTFPLCPSERARSRSPRRNRSVNEFGVSSWIAHGQPQSRCQPFALPIVLHGNANRVVSGLVRSESVGVLRN